MNNNRDIYEKNANGRYVHDSTERQRMIAERIENGTYFDYDPNQAKKNNDNEE